MPIWRYIGLTDNYNRAKITEENELLVAARLVNSEPITVDIEGTVQVAAVDPLPVVGTVEIDSVVPVNVTVVTPVAISGTVPVSLDEPLDVSVIGSVSVIGTMAISGPVAAIQSGSWSVAQSGTWIFTPASIAPVTSLSAVTSTGAGTALDAGRVVTGATLHVVATGDPAFDVEVQVSTDGSTWFDTGAAITVSGTSALASAHGRYYRANLTALTGGTTPTVTAILATSF